MSVWQSVHMTPYDAFCLPTICLSICLFFSLSSIACPHVCLYGSRAPLPHELVKALQLCGQGRPGAGLSPVNLRQLEMDLKDKHGKNSITYRDVMSSAMYPQVFDEFK